jgi:hypothetical protein
LADQLICGFKTGHSKTAGILFLPAAVAPLLGKFYRLKKTFKIIEFRD